MGFVSFVRYQPNRDYVSNDDIQTRRPSPVNWWTISSRRGGCSSRAGETETFLAGYRGAGCGVRSRKIAIFSPGIGRLTGSSPIRRGARSGDSCNTR